VLLKQLQNLREGKPTEAAPAPVTGQKMARPASAAAASAPAPHKPQAGAAAAPPPAASAPLATAPPQEELADLWLKLVEAVGRASPFTRTYLLEAHAVSFQKSVFIIGFDPEFEDHLSLVDNARNHTLLQTKLTELGHPNAQIKFIKAEAPANPPPPEAAAAAPPVPAPATPAAPKAPGPARSAATAANGAKEKLASVPFSKDDFKNDPLIQKALEIFKGQIVEVRA
jgi:DNA polymerase-3 subunit gamma/tau